eukprot:10163838-Alexandrium_andersonii.AAC.1
MQVLGGSRARILRDCVESRLVDDGFRFCDVARSRFPTTLSPALCRTPHERIEWTPREPRRRFGATRSKLRASGA